MQDFHFGRQLHLYYGISAFLSAGFSGKNGVPADRKPFLSISICRGNELLADRFEDLSNNRCRKTLRKEILGR